MIVAALLSSLAQAGEWRLVGAYDASAVATLAPSSPTWVWGEGSRGMASSCGRAKSPDGLGIFEAEAVAAGLGPALVLLLERTAGTGTLGTEDVRVAVEHEGRRVLLQPMVEPRHLAISITAPPEASRFAQLVRTQLEVEACLEHKTGRGWTGHDVTRVRQAFLLERPLGDERSRKFFGGELDPVPALLGPPDACFVDGAREVPAPAADTSLWLVPTDIWGASLRGCGADEQAGLAVTDGAPRLPLTLTGGAGARPSALWTALEVDLAMADGEGDEEQRVRVTVRWDGRTLADDQPLFEPGETGVLGLVDLLALVPHRYPALDDRFVTLVVPEWQAVEALRRLDRAGVDETSATAEALAAGMATSPVGVTDAVGVLLAAPERLSVQVRPEAGGDWPNLAGVLVGIVRQPFGYTVGLVGGRSPLALPRDGAPDWMQTARGQRAFEQSAVTAALVVLLVVGIAGLRRLRDLWAIVPHERAHYWPGLGEETRVPQPGGGTPPPGGGAP